MSLLLYSVEQQSELLQCRAAALQLFIVTVKGIATSLPGRLRWQAVSWTDETVDNEGMGKKSSKSAHTHSILGTHTIVLLVALT